MLCRYIQRKVPKQWLEPHDPDIYPECVRRCVLSANRRWLPKYTATRHRSRAASSSYRNMTRLDSSCSRAGNVAGNVCAAGVCLTTSHSNAGPGPGRASARATGNNDIISAARNSSSSDNVLDCKVGDRHAACGGAVEVTTIIVLFDKDTVPGLAFVSNSGGR